MNLFQSHSTANFIQQNNIGSSPFGSGFYKSASNHLFDKIGHRNDSHMLGPYSPKPTNYLSPKLQSNQNISFVEPNYALLQRTLTNQMNHCHILTSPKLESRFQVTPSSPSMPLPLYRPLFQPTVHEPGNSHQQQVRTYSPRLQEDRCRVEHSPSAVLGRHNICVPGSPLYPSGPTFFGPIHPKPITKIHTINSKNKAPVRN